MKIIFAKKIGSCFGVKRAVKMAEDALERDPRPIHFLGEIVHNKKIIDEIKDRGGKFVSRPEQAKSGTLVIKAHGAPAFEAPGKILVRDATCPLVKRAQRAAQFLFEKGYRVVIIGDKEHSEVKGIKSYAQNRAIVLENESQARKLKKPGRLGVVAQTTQNLATVNKILKILRKNAKKLKWFNTICPEVLSRQKELSEMAQKAKEILVIGERNSANTRRLAETAKALKKPVWWVNSRESLKKLRFKKNSVLAVVSGTSVPDEEVAKIKKYLDSLK